MMHSLLKHVEVTVGELDAMIARDMAFIDRTIAAGQTELHPQVAVHFKAQLTDTETKLAVFLIASDFEGDAKSKIMAGIGAQVRQMQVFPVAVVMMSEGWMAPDDHTGTMPSNHPARTEALLVSALSVVGTGRMSFRRVTRDAGDRFVAGAVEGPLDADPFLLHDFFRGFATKDEP